MVAAAAARTKTHGFDGRKNAAAASKRKPSQKAVKAGVERRRRTGRRGRRRLT
jgi:hypothetical protein